MPIVILVILVLAGVLFGVANYFYNTAIRVNANGKKAKNPETDDYLPFEKDHSWIENAKFDEVYMQTFDGLLLYGMPIINNPERWVIIQHGYGSQGRHMSHSAKHFFNLGYSVLLVDGRGHGKSQGKYRGMGWHDRLDIVSWIDYLNDHYGCRAIVLYGISMGGATVMMTSGEKLPTNVKAVIEDCGYSSIRKELAYNLKYTYHLPSFPILNAASLICKAKAGFSLFKEGSAVKQLAKSNIPTLFIHGSEDKFVPTYMLDEVYEAHKGPKDKLLVKGAKHGLACWEDPEGYWSTIEGFLEKYVPDGL